MLNILADLLINEKLEPISIKIDCDKNKYPDVIESLKDKRNWVQDPNELIENKDHVFFTPNFLQMFDLKGLVDTSYLGIQTKFNAIQLGFKLAPLLTGRFDPRNQFKYANSPHCEYSEFVAFRCLVGKQKEKYINQH